MTAEIGECLVTRRFNEQLGRDELIVNRADPRVRIASELLEEISVLTARNEPRWSSLADDVLTIRADNRTVIYRIIGDSYDPADDSFLAEWPD